MCNRWHLEEAEFYHFKNLMCLGQEKYNLILGPFSLNTYEIWPVKFIWKINWCTKLISLFKNFTKFMAKNVTKKVPKVFRPVFLCFYTWTVLDLSEHRVIIEVSYIILIALVRVQYGKIFYEHAKYFHEPKASENVAWE